MHTCPCPPMPNGRKLLGARTGPSMVVRQCIYFKHCWHYLQVGQQPLSAATGFRTWVQGSMQCLASRSHWYHDHMSNFPSNAYRWKKNC